MADGLEIIVNGPIVLGESSRTLLWTAKAGRSILGSVKLVVDRQHMALLRELQLSGDDDRSRQTVSARLVQAVGEYCREHGVLKLKVHRDSRFDWMAGQLTRAGFCDARRSDGRMQFYLDIYRPPRRRRYHGQSGQAHFAS